jgi:3-hydroxyisobutyrate dehydrogenase
MSAAKLTHTIGWIGTGRMGFPMAARLAKAGAKVSAYNRTKSKAEPLREHGVTIVDTPADLADRDIVFTMVAESKDLIEVVLGPKGLFAGKGTPKILVDTSTVSEEASAQVRAEAAKRGVKFLASPVSGNGKVVKAGKVSFVASGPRDAFDAAQPYLNTIGVGSSYVGEGELARIVKICHNVLLGVTIQALVEITVLAEKAGVKRHAFLDFINNSVMGSMFTKYKTPALVNLDFAPTFTPPLLRKDMELGLSAARKLDMPMPIAAMTREVIQSLIGHGHLTDDFATLLLLQAENSGIEVKSENVPVSDGLS